MKAPTLPTAEEALQIAYDTIKANQSSEHKDVDPVLLHAIESLYRAIETDGWHFDNPYVDPGLIPSFELERFREAQSRVLDRSRCLLLGRE